MLAWYNPDALLATPATWPTSSKRRPPRFKKRNLADWSLATKRSTRPSPSRSVATTPSPSPGPVDDSCLGRDIDETPAVIAEEVIGHRRKFRRPAKGEYDCELCPSTRVGARCPTRDSGKRRDRGRRRRRGPRRPPTSASRGHPPARPCSVTSSNVPSPLLRKRA